MKNPGQRWRFARIAPVFALLVAVASDAADLPKEASFYAARFEPAFDSLVTIVQLMKDCRRQLGDLCNERAMPTLDYSLMVVGAITIFKSDGLRNRANHFQDEQEFVQRLQDEQTRFFSLLQPYEEELIARLVAVSLVCRESSVEYLTTLQKFDFIRVWGLPDEQIKAAFQRISDNEKSLIPEIQKWPRERCVATRAFGKPLVALLWDKVDPYKAKAAPVATRTQRFGSGGGLVSGVALVLQSSVDPDVLHRVAVD
jgi:hypothetical protein